MSLSRQDLPVLEGSGPGVGKGAYKLRDGADGTLTYSRWFFSSGADTLAVAITAAAPPMSEVM